jgi:hypothetical protein
MKPATMLNRMLNRMLEKLRQNIVKDEGEPLVKDHLRIFLVLLWFFI